MKDKSHLENKLTAMCKQMNTVHRESLKRQSPTSSEPTDSPMPGLGTVPGATPSVPQNKG